MWAWSLILLCLAGQVGDNTTNVVTPSIPGTSETANAAAPSAANADVTSGNLPDAAAPAPDTPVNSSSQGSEASAASALSDASKGLVPTSGALNEAGSLSSAPSLDPKSDSASDSASSQIDAEGSSTNDPTRRIINIALALAVFVLPVLLAGPIAQACRMPNDSTRFAIVLFSILAGAVVCVFGWPPKLGVDLAGGTILVYETAEDDNEGQATAGKNVTEQSAARTAQEGGSIDMDKLSAAIRRRIDPAGVKELMIRRRGRREVEIVMPKVEASEVEEIKRRISKIGALEFRIPANPRDINHEDEIRLADSQFPNRRVMTQDGREIARWVKLSPTLRGAEAGFHTRAVPGQSGLEALVLIDPFNVTGANLVRAVAGMGETGGREVQFMLDSKGGNAFGRLTGRNLPDPATGISQRLAVVLDNEILSAPNLESQINSNGRITGIQDPKEIDFVVDILNAGSLPAALNPNPLSEQSISPTLGSDTIRSGVGSMLLATALVVIFMIVYYHFSGLVAVFVLALNLLLVVASMIAIKAAFTLPGLAGLVLTVGMAVDSNVLIYERMREELLRGSGLRMAIRNGFNAATATIIDSNLTTLIVAFVLYAIGTDQIKGFAVTLILGLALSMFTAVYVARLLFDVLERNRWLTKITMFRLLTTTNFDFVKTAPIFMAVSAIIIVIGLIAVAARGVDILDNDFRSGVTVHALWKEKQDIANIRKVVEGEGGLPGANVYAVSADSREFKIDTSVDNVQAVKQTLAQLFGDQLQRNEVKCDDLRPVSAASSTNSAPANQTGDSTGNHQTGTDSASGKVGQRAPLEQPALMVAPNAPLALFGVLQDAASEQPANGAAAPADATAQSDTAVPTTPVNGELPNTTTSTEQAPASADSPVTQPEQATATNTEPSPVPSTNAASSDATSSNAASTNGAAADSTSAQQGSATSGQSPGPTEQSVPKGGATVAPSPTSDPFANGCQGLIKLVYPMNHASVSAEIQSAAVAANLPDVPFALSNPGYTTGSGTPFLEWEFKTSLPLDQGKKLIETLNANLSKMPVFPTSSQVGANVAGDTQVQAINALLISLIGIIIYVWFRFSHVSWGVAGVVALVHDVLMMLGFIALSYYLAPFLGVLLIDPFKISLTIVAAFLTIVGYSINDTIVIFDRMREVKGKSPELTANIINASLNQTLSRTIITSLTVFMVVVPLYLLGGQAIHGFAFALIVGVVFGSYSSLFIAAPLVLWITGQSGKNRPNARVG